MKIGYFDCFAGAGGDMIIAAMLDAGLDEGFLRGQLETLRISGLEITNISGSGSAPILVDNTSNTSHNFIIEYNNIHGNSMAMYGNSWQ